MLNPKIVRKQISVYKFLRIKASPDSSRVRLFIADNYKIVTPIEAYLHKGRLYVMQGEIKPLAGTLTKRKTLAYRTTFFRYEITPATYIAERVVG